ncbi:DUF3102 domain-containing protein [Paenibacillus sp. MBLB4367]|uniref:DUF3102 domain-containing protein n=1 Tax=Paenibacillus sp. MBLB4367 TaxID=3384767 RepID=UPI003907F9A8
MNQITKLSDEINVITVQIQFIEGEIEKTMNERAFQIGQLLNHVKETLQYGKFTEWVNENFRFSRRYAYNFMNYYKDNELVQSTSQLPSFTKEVEIMSLLPAERNEVRTQIHVVPSTGEEKHFDELTQKELREVKRAKKEAEDRADQLDAEKRNLEKQLKNVIPIDQLDEVVDFRLEQHREQSEIEKQQIIAEKDREIRALESRKPEVLTKEVVPQKVKDELDELRHYVRKLTSERKELEEKHKELSDLEYREKKLQIEGRTSIYELQIKIKQFIEDAAPTLFLQGAIASNPIMKKDIEGSIVSLEEFCSSMRDVLNSKIQIVEV